jgi:hypothetical protein
VKYGAQEKETQERVMEETQYERLGRWIRRDYHRWRWLEMNFASKAKYERWLRYGFAHKLFHGKQPITIRGKKHKVVHEK